jgi:hypothetical protein
LEVVCALPRVVSSALETYSAIFYGQTYRVVVTECLLWVALGHAISCPVFRSSHAKLPFVTRATQTPAAVVATFIRFAIKHTAEPFFLEADMPLRAGSADAPTVVVSALPASAVGSTACAIFLAQVRGHPPPSVVAGAATNAATGVTTLAGTAIGNRWSTASAFETDLFRRALPACTSTFVITAGPLVALLNATSTVYLTEFERDIPISIVADVA